jgi:hypothetical protein
MLCIAMAHCLLNSWDFLSFLSQNNVGKMWAPAVIVRPICCVMMVLTKMGPKMNMSKKLGFVMETMNKKWSIHKHG